MKFTYLSPNQQSFVQYCTCLVMMTCAVSAVWGSSNDTMAGIDTASDLQTPEVWQSGKISNHAAPNEDDIESSLPIKVIRARMGVWFPAPSGETRFGSVGGGNSVMDIEETLRLNDAEPAINADLTFKIDERWIVWFDAFETGFDSIVDAPAAGLTVNGNAIPGGTSISNDLNITSLGLHVGYDFFGDLLHNDYSDDHNAEIHVHLMGGLRGINIDHSLRTTAPGLNIGYDEWNGTLDLGGRLSIEVARDAILPGSLDVSLSMLGGFGGTSDGDITTLDLLVVANWMPHPNLGLLMGFRLFDITLDDNASGNDYRYDGRMAGIFLGGVFEYK